MSAFPHPALGFIIPTHPLALGITAESDAGRAVHRGWADDPRRPADAILSGKCVGGIGMDTELRWAMRGADPVRSECEESLNHRLPPSLELSRVLLLIVSTAHAPAALLSRSLAACASPGRLLRRMGSTVLWTLQAALASPTTVSTDSDERAPMRQPAWRYHHLPCTPPLTRVATFQSRRSRRGKSLSNDRRSPLFRLAPAFAGGARPRRPLHSVHPEHNAAAPERPRRLQHGPRRAHHHGQLQHLRRPWSTSRTSGQRRSARSISPSTTLKPPRTRRPDSARLLRHGAAAHLPPMLLVGAAALIPPGRALFWQLMITRAPAVVISTTRRVSSSCRPAARSWLCCITSPTCQSEPSRRGVPPATKRTGSAPERRTRRRRWLWSEVRASHARRLAAGAALQFCRMIVAVAAASLVRARRCCPLRAATGRFFLPPR